MRRTLALAGAAALAVGFTGMAGPANADPSIDAQVGELVISEVAVNLDGTGQANGISGDFIEIFNTADGARSIANFEVTACSSTQDEKVTTIPSSVVLPAKGRFLVADSDYAGGPTRNRAFDPAASGLLEQPNGGVELRDASNGLMGDVRWGDPASVCDNFDPAGNTPTNTESLTYDHVTGTWSPLAPTPGA